MKPVLKKITMVLLAVMVTAVTAHGAVRIKDIAKIEGVRENQLFGYGIVVGLAGSGDGVRMTKQTIANMLERLGLVVDVNDINADNVAAVMVTATLPAFVKSGDTIDVVVSSIGDADSLQGGTLILTPLKGADGNVYAIAQGGVSIGGWNSSSGGGKQAKGHPTVARIPNGATVENTVPTEIIFGESIFLSMNTADFTTATNIADGVNFRFGRGSAKAVNSSTIEITPPADALDNIVPFISELENIQVDQEQVSKVVINEKTGTIVMGGDVSITPVAIAHGTLTVMIKPRTEIYQPDTSFTLGETVAIQSESIDTEEKEVVFTRISTGDVVDALNKMGVTSSDIIAILQALKVAGALQADIIIM